jgi:hypothetical protein
VLIVQQLDHGAGGARAQLGSKKIAVDADPDDDFRRRVPGHQRASNITSIGWMESSAVSRHSMYGPNAPQFAHQAQILFCFYFFMTGFHALHMVSVWEC